MKVWTYGEAADKLKLDLDLQEDGGDDQFVTDNELIGYFNEGIDEAEALIHKIHEDYFLSTDTLTLVNGTKDYSLPSDIYANKIRAVMYVNGTNVYEVRRVSNLRKFESLTWANINAGNADYQYIVINLSSTLGYQMRLFPTAYEAGALLQRWYLRNATRLPLVGEINPLTSSAYALSEVEAFPIDIPEFISFVLEYVRVKVLSKDGDPRLDSHMAELQGLRQTMVDTLTQMVPDDHDEIPADFSHYIEHT